MQTRLIRSEILEMRGRDAIAFAQAQFMNDVLCLGEGDWQWNGLLTPKGRVIAFFALYRLTDDALLAWLPAGGAKELRERLERYVFRSKVIIDHRAPWCAIGRFDDTNPLPDGALMLAFPADDDHARRRLLLVPSSNQDSAPDVYDNEEDANAVRWRLADLRLGVPYIAAGAANSEQFVPQWLSLDRLNAYSLKKGCYPGQEIVSRVHYLGQSKRAAFRLRGEGMPPVPMTRVQAEDGLTLGDVVWSQSLPDRGWAAMSVLSGNADQVEWVVDQAGERHFAARWSDS